MRLGPRRRIPFLSSGALLGAGVAGLVLAALLHPGPALAQGTTGARPASGPGAGSASGYATAAGVGASGAVAAAGGSDCLGCHARPLTVTRQGRTVTLTIDSAAYEASPHGQVGCVLCHGPDPHVGLQQVRARALSACGDCHAGHDFSGGIQTVVSAVPDQPGLWVHPAPPLDCTGCHGPTHAVVPRSDPASSLNRANVVGFCGSCHKAEADAYLLSFHGSAYRLGSTAAPACGDCHAHLPPVRRGGQVAAGCVRPLCHSGSGTALANLMASGAEHVTPLDRTKGVDGLARWVTWKFFLVLILLNVTKDGTVIAFDLACRWRQAGRERSREKIREGGARGRERA